MDGTVENAVKEVVRMGQIASENLKRAMDGVLAQVPSENVIEEILKKEVFINKMEKALTEYLIKIRNLSLSEEQNETAVELAKRKARWIMANQGRMDIGCSVLREVVVEEDSND